MLLRIKIRKEGWIDSPSVITSLIPIPKLLLNPDSNKAGCTVNFYSVMVVIQIKIPETHACLNVNNACT